LRITEPNLHGVYAFESPLPEKQRVKLRPVMPAACLSSQPRCLDLVQRHTSLMVTPHAAEWNT
jgi:hypothetical protein